MAAQPMPPEEYCFIDSMPLEIYKLGRAKRIRIFQEAEASRPGYGSVKCGQDQLFLFFKMAHKESFTRLKTDGIAG